MKSFIILKFLNISLKIIIKIAHKFSSQILYFLFPLKESSFKSCLLQKMKKYLSLAYAKLLNLLFLIWKSILFSLIRKINGKNDLILDRFWSKIHISLLLHISCNRYLLNSVLIYHFLTNTSFCRHL